MKVFISYSHKDIRRRKALEKHLAPLKRINGLENWHDGEIPPGSEFDPAIKKALTTADIIVLLVSADFFASDYCYCIEMTEAVNRHNAGTAHVLPIIVDHVARWRDAPFGKLKVLPDDGLPVVDWRPQSKAWACVAEGIHALLKAGPKEKAPASGTRPESTAVHLPWPRNPYFQDPHDLLGRIAGALDKGGAVAVTHGMGGVGKTQAALHYAHAYGDRYRVVWWVEAETAAGRDLGYQTLAKALNLPEAEAREAAAVRTAVRDWLARHDGWLLVFDNAEDTESLKDWLPVRPAGHALITSRSPDWDRVATPIPVDRWSVADSATFLLARTGLTDRPAAEALARDLDGLALALEQAAAYIRHNGCGFAAYRRLFAERFAVLAAQGKPGDYPATLLTTWDVSLTAAEKACPAAGDLLRLLAFFAPDDIPRSLFTEHGKELPEPLAPLADEITFNDAVGALQRHALLKADPDSLSLHRLVQRVTRSRIDDQALWVNAGVRLVANAFPFDSDDVRFWPECIKLRSHAEALLDNTDDTQAEVEHIGRLLNQLGLFLRQRAETASAKQAFERALRIEDPVYGLYHPETAIRVSNLAGILHDIGDLDGARLRYECSLEINQKINGPNHKSVAIDLNNIGSIMRKMGKAQEAKSYFERALEIAKNSKALDANITSVIINNHACALQDMGDLKEALSEFQMALDIDLSTYGTDHPSIAIRYNNIASICFIEGDYLKSRDNLNLALIIFEKHFGPEHPRTILTRENKDLCERIMQIFHKD